jgi:membrane fusion protein (multidrug efflux system)
MQGNLPCQISYHDEGGNLENRQDDTKEKGSQEGRPSQSIRKRLLRPWVILLAVLAVALGGAYWWFFLYGRVDTDDAYVRAHSASISSRIWGTVVEVRADNDDRVKAGQVLIRLDPEDYQVAVDSSQALLNRRDADVKKAEVQIALTDSQTESQVRASTAQLERAKEEEKAMVKQVQELEKKQAASQADYTYAHQEYERYKELYDARTVSRQAYDDVLKSFRVAEANLKAVEAEVEGARSSLLADQQQVNQAEANLSIAQSGRKQVQIQFHALESLKAQRDEAKSSLDQAKLNLSYCTIEAPLDGSIAQRNVQVGDRLQPGVPVMSVVPLERIYAEANFKETQLTYVQPGQPARIKADIYPDHTYSGKVSGIRPGTGAAFSVLPPQNATGNWIKVVQRVPVTIEFDKPLAPDRPLMVGLSLTVTIDTRKKQ